MRTNVGQVDRRLRVALGGSAMALAAAGVVGRWGWLGVVPVLTGLVRFCPMYAVLGVNSCQLSSAETGTHQE
jgi:hypothetical protein